MSDVGPENALQNVRAEFVNETTVGEVPTDPSWNRLSDHIAEYPMWDGDAGVSFTTPAGSGDPEFTSRGAESHSLGCRYYLQRFFVDGSGNPQDPIGEVLDYTYGDAFPTQSVLFRRESTEGGNDGAGYRHYVVGRGCYPLSADLPGDPSSDEPIIGEIGWDECEKVETHVIHQPSSSTTLDVTGLASGNGITIESEDASTTDSLSSDGTTTESFADIDAVVLDQPQADDVTISDGGGTTLMTIQGDAVEGDLGVPALGAGSHSSAIGTDPAQYVFLGTSSTFAGGALAESAPSDRIHAFDLSAQIGATTNPKQGTRRPTIDIGTRTVEVDAQVAGPYESDVQNKRYYSSESGDIVYSFPDGTGGTDTLTVKNATPANTDEVTYEGGDEVLVYSITFQAVADSANSEPVVMF